MSPWSQERYLSALHFAGEAHAGQRYPGTEICYLMHLSIVSMEILAALRLEAEHDGDLAMQCALLHDVLEDTARSFEELRVAFGRTVAEGVEALSKRPAESKRAAMLDSLQRIRAQPHEIWMVKLADRICNLQSPPHYWPLEKRRAYQEEARIILAELGAASPALAARLREKIESYSAFLS